MAFLIGWLLETLILLFLLLLFIHLVKVVRAHHANNSFKRTPDGAA
jgi:hypothetical protein